MRNLLARVLFLVLAVNAPFAWSQVLHDGNVYRLELQLRGPNDTAPVPVAAGLRALLTNKSNRILIHGTLPSTWKLDGTDPIGIPNVLELGCRLNFLQFVVVEGETMPGAPKSFFDPPMSGSAEFEQFVKATAAVAKVDIVTARQAALEYFEYPDALPFYWEETGPVDLDHFSHPINTAPDQSTFRFFDMPGVPPKASFHFVTMLVVSKDYAEQPNWTPLQWWVWSAHNRTNTPAAVVVPDVDAFGFNIDNVLPYFFTLGNTENPTRPELLEFEVVGHSMDLMELPEWIRDRLRAAGGNVPSGPTVISSLNLPQILGAEDPGIEDPSDPPTPVGAKIEIHQGSYPANVVSAKGGPLSVAIQGTPGLDVQSLDLPTIKVMDGATGQNVPVSGIKVKDLNKDGRVDLQFKIKSAPIPQDMLSLVFSARNKSGQAVTASGRATVTTLRWKDYWLAVYMQEWKNSLNAYRKGLRKYWW